MARKSALRLWAVAFWLAVWQAGSMAFDQALLLPSPLAALARLGEERQILLFTCHSREARLAEGREGAAVLRLQS